MLIQLAHYEFDLSERYRAGSVIGEAEAKTLNVQRSERIRNKVARWLERAAPEGEVLTGAALAELRAFVSEIDSNYEFEIRDVKKAKRGTLEAGVRELAVQRAEALARERGKAGDLELIGQLTEGLLDDPRLEAQAAAMIEARNQVAREGLGDL